jgi:hypothetical protein
MQPAAGGTSVTFRVRAPALDSGEGVSLIFAGDFQLPVALSTSEAAPGIFFTARPLRLAAGVTSYRYCVTAADGRVQVRAKACARHMCARCARSMRRNHRASSFPPLATAALGAARWRRRRRRAAAGAS